MTPRRNTGTWYRVLVPLLGSTINFNAILNFFIYTGRHHDMRLGAKYLFKCKVRCVKFFAKKTLVQILTKAAMEAKMQKDKSMLQKRVGGINVGTTGV